jgi:hypothetical protein
LSPLFIPRKHTNENADHYKVVAKAKKANPKDLRKISICFLTQIKKPLDAAVFV